MPGTTSPNTLPYPYLAETVDSDSVRLLAEAVDAKLNTAITSANTMNKRPAALVVRDSGTQSFASAAALANLTYTTEHYDNNGMGNLGTNNERLTIATAGLYAIYARVLLDGASTTVAAWALVITVNGTILAGTKRRGGSGAAFSSCCDTDMSCVLMRKLVATDVVRAQFAWAGTSSPRNVERAELGARWVCT